MSIYCLRARYKSLQFVGVDRFALLKSKSPDLNNVYDSIYSESMITAAICWIEWPDIHWLQQHSWLVGLCQSDFSECSVNNFLTSYPFSCLVLQKGSYDSVQGVDVPRLVHKMDSSEPGRKAVLWAIQNTNTLTILPVGMVIHFWCDFR